MDGRDCRHIIKKFFFVCMDFEFVGVNDWSKDGSMQSRANPSTSCLLNTLLLVIASNIIGILGRPVLLVSHIKIPMNSKVLQSFSRIWG